MQRTCIVTPDLAGPTRNGGIGTQCLYLARLLARLGDEVTIVHTGVPDDVDRERWRAIYDREHGARLRFLDELSNEPTVPILPHTERHVTAHRVHRWLKEQTFDTIHFQDWQGNGAICCRAKQTGAAFAGTRLIVTTHGPSEWIREGMGEFPTEGRESLIDDALERAAVALADVVVSPSRHLLSWLRERGWQLPAETRVAPCLFERPTPLPQPRTLAPHELSELVFFGRLETRKGLEPFLTALERIAATKAWDRSIEVYFLGKEHTTIAGPAHVLIDEASARGGGSFHFHIETSLDHAAALAWLAAHPKALVVTPSLIDNSPFSVIECLTLGQPLLTSTRGGIPELVASADHMVEPTPTALAERLMDVFEHGLPACVPGYSIEASVAAWTAVAELPAIKPRPAPAAPRISVCVPHWNQPASLAEVLKRLAEQTIPPHEVIVVDDGSDPAHDSAWNALAAEHQRAGWHFLRQENAGPSTARNTAADRATGEAIVFCDADNRPARDMLEQLDRALVLSGADIVTTAFTAHRCTATASVWPERAEYLFSPIGDAAELALLENFIGDVNFIIRSERFRTLGGFDTDNRAASEDWELLWRATATGAAIAVLPEPVFQYRLAIGSHARSHTAVASAEAVWRTLPPGEHMRYKRLLHAARGTFADRRAALDRLQRLRDAQLAAANQHATNLEAIAENARLQHQAAQTHAAALEEQLRLSSVHAENIERIVAGCRRQIASLEEHLRLAQAHGQNLERILSTERSAHASELAALTADRDRTQDALDDLAREHAESVALLESRIREREAKIARMQATFSWRATAPLRALRRQLLDPRREAPNTNAGGATPSTTAQSTDTNVRVELGPIVSAPGYHVSIDSPKSWQDIRTRRFAIAGWVVRADDSTIRQIRARCDADVFVGRYGIARPDVAANFPGMRNAQRPGFEVDVRAGAAGGRFVLEARTPTDEWEVFWESSWTLSPNATEIASDLYQAWIGANEDFSAGGLQRLRDEVNAWSDLPVVSIVMPTYNTAERWLTAAIESVRAQVYPAWELCIADDASTDAAVRPILEKYAGLDPRIKVCFRPTNGHISAASNSALELATGEWLALLDHDDELSPDALLEIVREIQRHPGAELVYSDEDKIDETGRRFDPYFKPDWQLDLLLGQNFISHLGVYRTNWVRELGGLRAGFEGSQDWDLALRIVEKIPAASIRHVPRVLYHWRAIPGSTAVEVNQKNYAVNAGKRALREHLARTGQDAELVPVPGHNWRVRRRLPSTPPRVSLLIPTRDRVELLRRCVETILQHTSYPDYEVVIIDNESRDPATLEWFRTIAGERVRVLPYHEPFNYSAINNFAARQTGAAVLGFLNNDLEALHADWLDEMVAQATRPDVGCVGAMLYYPDNTVQHAGVLLGVGGVANHAFLRFARGSDGYFNRLRLVQSYSAVTGACLVVRHEVFDAVGGFNERDLTIAFNDVDLCLRVRAAGYRNLWTPFAEFVHHESASRGQEDTPEKHARFAREVDYMRYTWGAELDLDPCYSPHLSLDYPDFTIASPPRPVPPEPRDGSSKTATP